MIAPMRCFGCAGGAEGYAVIPGIGEAGEIRFFCDPCARRHRVKMRYWDGRDLDIGGHRDDPDLGPSFRTLILGFEDVARMRRQDLRPVLDWMEDPELALSLVGAGVNVAEKIYSSLPTARAQRVRDLIDSPGLWGTSAAATPEAARDLLVNLIRRL